MLANRITCVVLICVSIILYIFVIPQQVEDPIFEGYTTPATVPNIAVIGIAIMAILQFFNTKNQPDFDKKVFIKSLLIALFGLCAIWAMGKVGFLSIAPILSVLVMVLVGERKIPWLALGAIMPIGFWVLVVQVLNRSLP